MREFEQRHQEQSEEWYPQEPLIVMGVGAYLGLEHYSMLYFFFTQG